MSGRPPYPGLRSFDRDEAEVFFGRDRCLDGMAQTLQDTRFLAVLGPSGSGKSSLVRSGLFMHLEAGLAPKAGSRWTFLDIRHPRTHPFRELGRATLQCEAEQADPNLAGTAAAEPDEARLQARRRELRTGPLSLVRWWRDHPRHPNANLLVLVDQFEELFGYTTPRERDEVEAFVDLLLHTAANDELDIYVVLTMRSEFLGGCALFPGLAEQINRSLSLTPRMTREECRSAITGPAYGEELTLEPLLVTTLLNDMNSLAQFDEPAASEDGASDEAAPVAELRQSDLIARRADQLPLMQHLLNWMWMLASARASTPDAPIHLTLDDYLALGGLRGAMSRHAKEVMDSTGEPELTSRIFRALTDQPAVATSGSAESSAVRRRRTVAELAAETGASEDQVRAVVDAFRAEGVSMLTPEPAVALTSDIDVDITHESLIRQWSDLSGWIREEAESGRAWQELLRDVGERKQLRGLDLAERRGWWQRTRPHAGWAARYGGEFAAVDASLTSDWRAERRRKLMWGAGTAGLAAIALSSVAVFGTAFVALGKAREATRDALDAEFVAQTRAAKAVKREHDARELAVRASVSTAKAVHLQAEAQKKSKEAVLAAAAASKAAAVAALRVRQAELASANIVNRLREIVPVSPEQSYADLQEIWEKKPAEARQTLKNVRTNLQILELTGPTSFAEIEPELDKARGEMFTYDLETKGMREVVAHTVAEAGSGQGELERLRRIQADTLLARAERFEGRPLDALAALERATAAPGSAVGTEIRLAVAEAQFERASALFDLEQWQGAAAAARGCLQIVQPMEVKAAPSRVPEDDKAEQMRLRPAFADFRCQSLLAATAETEEEAVQQMKQAEDVIDAADIATYTADVSVARAEMLVRYFRRHRKSDKRGLPAEIVEPIRNFGEYLPRDTEFDFSSPDSDHAARSDLRDDVYPLQALLWARSQNELVRRFLQDGPTSSIELADASAIMNQAQQLLAALPMSGGEIAGLNRTVSDTYAMFADNWIGLERLVDSQTDASLKGALPGASTAIERHWRYLRSNGSDRPDAETLARISRLRAQAIELVEAGRRKQTPVGLLVQTGRRLQARLCPERSELPPDENCERLKTSVEAVRADAKKSPAPPAKPKP